MRNIPPIFLIVALRSIKYSIPYLYFSFLTPLNGSLSAFWTNPFSPHPDPLPMRGDRRKEFN